MGRLVAVALLFAGVVGDDEVVGAGLRRERGLPVLVRGPLVVGIRPFLEGDAARDEADLHAVERLALEQEFHLDRRPRPHRHHGVDLGDQFDLVAQRLVEAGLVLRHLVERVADDEVGLGALVAPNRLAVVQHLVEGLGGDVEAGLGGDELGRVEALLRGVPEVGHVPLQVGVGRRSRWGLGLQPEQGFAEGGGVAGAVRDVSQADGRVRPGDPVRGAAGVVQGADRRPDVDVVVGAGVGEVLPGRPAGRTGAADERVRADVARAAEERHHGADEVGVRLHPGVVGRGEPGGSDEGDGERRKVTVHG